MTDDVQPVAVEPVAASRVRTSSSTRLGLLVPAGVAVALVALPLLALLVRAD